MNKWTLSILSTKGKQFVITRLSKIIIKKGDYEINRVYDYLGIVLDYGLTCTWKDHVRYVISSEGKRVGVVKAH